MVKAIQEATTNWETSAMGVGAILTAVGAAITAMFDGNPDTHVNWSLLLPAVMAGIGLIRSRDANKTSRQSGAE